MLNHDPFTPTDRERLYFEVARRKTNRKDVALELYDLKGGRHLLHWAYSLGTLRQVLNEVRANF